MRTREQVVDELLVLAAQARNVEAFHVLATRWHPRLLRYALRLTGDPDGAAEAVQDAWVSIARGLRRLDDPSRFGSWSLRITSRRCADWIRRRQRSRRRTIGLDTVADLLPSADPTEDHTDAVRHMLRRLDSDRRALMALYYVDGLSVAEIAQVFEIPAGTVKSRLHHAREMLRASLEV